MNILSAWLRSYVPPFDASDRTLADDLTQRGIAVEGVIDVAAPGGGCCSMVRICTGEVCVRISRRSRSGLRSW